MRTEPLASAADVVATWPGPGARRWQDDAVSDFLHEPGLRGIAFNPAAPSDVLIRLVDRAAGEAGLLMCEGRDLPDDVIDAALRHPARGIRRALAGNRHVDPSRLAALATDPSGIVRARLVSSPYPRPRWVRPLPDDILVTLLTAQDGGEDGVVTEHEIVEVPPGRSLCPFTDPWPGTSIPGSVYAPPGGGSRSPLRSGGSARRPRPRGAEGGAGEQLGAGPGSGGGQAAVHWLAQQGARARHVRPVPALVEQCFADDTVHPLAWNRHTPADAAARPDLGPDLVAELREDPDEDVRMRARLHPFPRTWAEYWAINRVIGHGPDCICPITEPATEPSPDWFAACAASEEPVLRRVAASWPGLPQNSSRHSHRMTTRRYGSGWPATTRWLRHTSSWTSLSPARPTVRTC